MNKYLENPLATLHGPCCAFVSAFLQGGMVIRIIQTLQTGLLRQIINYTITVIVFLAFWLAPYSHVKYVTPFVTK